MFHLRQRPVDESVRLLNGLMMWLYVPAFLVFLSMIAFAFSRGGLPWARAMTLILVGVIAAVPLWAEWSTKVLHKRGVACIPQWELPAITTPLLLLRVAGDEASAALAAGRLAGWLIQKLLRWRTAVVFIGYGVVVAALVAILSLSSNRPLTPDEFFIRDGFNSNPTAFGRMVMSTGWVGLLLLLFAITLVPTLLLAGLGFGWDSALVLCAAELSAEETPPGEWRVRQFSLIKQTGYPQPVFEHGALYEHLPAILAIADWIKTNASVSAPR